MTQAKGRIDRCNSPFDELHYYYFISPDFEIDQEILNALTRKEKFNEEALANKHFIGYQEDEGSSFIENIRASQVFERSATPYRHRRSNQSYSHWR